MQLSPQALLDLQTLQHPLLGVPPIPTQFVTEIAAIAANTTTSHRFSMAISIGGDQRGCTSDPCSVLRHNGYERGSESFDSIRSVRAS